MTPNSAGAERVFSLLKNMFPKECNLSLADLIDPQFGTMSDLGTTLQILDHGSAPGRTATE